MIAVCPVPTYVPSRVVGLKHVKELLLLYSLNCLPAPKESEQLRSGI